MGFLQKNSGTKRSLILAGGGARLSYHAGVLMALEEANLSFDHVDGTSGGIFGTAMLASGISPKESARRWRNVKLSGFMSLLPLKKYLSKQTLSALGDSDGIRNKIFPALGIDVRKINLNTDFDASFNVCNFSRKTFESIPHERVTLDHLIAGMSLPIFTPAVPIGEDWYTDGVWIKDANLAGAVDRGAEEIWVVWCIGNTPEYKNGFFNQYVHMIEMSANSSLFEELDGIKRLNAEREKSGLQPIKVHIIKPEFPLPLDPELFLGMISVDTLINMGYADTKKYLASEKKSVLSDIHSSTAMTEPESSLHFCQQFSGTLLAGGHKISSVNLGFFVMELKTGETIRIYSALVIDGVSISCYNAKITPHTAGALEIESSVLIMQQEYRVGIIITKVPILDFSLGLGPKTAIVSIEKKGEVQKAVRAFYQTGRSRINNSFLSNVHANGNFLERLKKKRELLKSIYTT